MHRFRDVARRRWGKIFVLYFMIDVFFCLRGRRWEIFEVCRGWWWGWEVLFLVVMVTTVIRGGA